MKPGETVYVVAKGRAVCMLYLKKTQQKYFCVLESLVQLACICISCFVEKASREVGWGDNKGCFVARAVKGTNMFGKPLSEL